MAKTKFKELSKYDKIFRIINLSVMAILLGVIIGLTIYFMTIKDPNNRVPAGFAMMFAVVAPYLFELVFRTRISNLLFIGIEVYASIAGIWGSLLNGYNQFFWLDIVTHSIMGYLCAIVGIFLISRLTDYKKITPLAVLFFCFFFSMAVELIWELAEWFADLFINQTAQGIKIFDPATGKWAPQVTDTMEDIFCNFCGGLVFIIHFAIGKFTKCSLGINLIENELAKGVKESNSQKVETIVEAQKPEKTIEIEEKNIKENAVENIKTKPKKSRKKE